jgi:hypothetical protein
MDDDYIRQKLDEAFEHCQKINEDDYDYMFEFMQNYAACDFDTIINYFEEKYCKKITNEKNGHLRNGQ